MLRGRCPGTQNYSAFFLEFVQSIGLSSRDFSTRLCEFWLNVHNNYIYFPSSSFCLRCTINIGSLTHIYILDVEIIIYYINVLPLLLLMHNKCYKFNINNYSRAWKNIVLPQHLLFNKEYSTRCSTHSISKLVHPNIWINSQLFQVLFFRIPVTELDILLFSDKPANIRRLCLLLK